MPRVELSDPLTQEERNAGSWYGADATLIHACHQWLSPLFTTPGYPEFVSTAAAKMTALDSAIAKGVLQAPVVVYSGHGVGLPARGSLEGDAAKFVGLTLKYPGYVSTSSERAVAERFLETRARPGSRPTLLEIRLPQGYNALDMVEAGHHGEFELLLPKSSAYLIVDAQYCAIAGVSDQVLILVLEPRS